MNKALNLLWRDTFRLGRDKTLIFLIVYPFVSALVGRFLVPFIPIKHFSLYLAPALIIFAPLAFGMVFGFNLIEEKEEQTWLIVRVVPLRTSTYFTYLVLATALPSLLLGLITALIYRQPISDIWQFSMMLIATSLTAPLWALLLGIIARNKIEGLALSKIVSFIMLAPAIAFFASPTVQLSVAWNPWYWIYIGLLNAYAGSAIISDLAINVPKYPEFVFWLAPATLSLITIVRLASIWRKIAE